MDTPHGDLLIMTTGDDRQVSCEVAADNGTIRLVAASTTTHAELDTLIGEAVALLNEMERTKLGEVTARRLGPLLAIRATSRAHLGARMWWSSGQLTMQVGARVYRLALDRAGGNITARRVQIRHGYPTEAAS
ncbi:hypothetical protein N866_06835 [Actinotalea ferrariae CF5-4]|uniref:Uncharacterized protein n=1 Tax=Actinotalea ferrariae CF5-4 TaxID=948458 RepID=A0A021VN84_9CELL|nr:hypothetical protein [Actinotalea ferrariae]EYR62616.1 hypothetical protein N866_06835 [Actinotalea ferrariae CF5-4]